MSDLKKLGPKGEAYALDLLKKRGHKLLAQNVSCPVGEIDLVTRHGDTLVFVEVRARSSVQFGTPAETITRSKQQKVRRAAEWYLAKTFKNRALPNCRFDVVALIADNNEIKSAEVIEGAFY